MDNKTIRLAIMKRCPEIYFISKPKKNGQGKVLWLMYAKIEGQKRPIRLLADMPDTAILSFKELMNTMVSEIYDEIQAIKKGVITPPDDPWDIDTGVGPLSQEGQKVFDSPEIQYYAKGTPNIDPKKGRIIIP